MHLTLIDNSSHSFLFDMESELYLRYRKKVETYRKGVIAESTSRKEEQKKKKKLFYACAMNFIFRIKNLQIQQATCWMDLPDDKSQIKTGKIAEQ